MSHSDTDNEPLFPFLLPSLSSRLTITNQPSTVAIPAPFLVHTLPLFSPLPSPETTATFPSPVTFALIHSPVTLLFAISRPASFFFPSCPNLASPQLPVITTAAGVCTHNGHRATTSLSLSSSSPRFTSAEPRTHRTTTTPPHIPIAQPSFLLPSPPVLLCSVRDPPPPRSSLSLCH
ncbi:hypothetical protein AHAS_Ahas15G0269200 [Arachis hypogaea]